MPHNVSNQTAKPVADQSSRTKTADTPHAENNGDQVFRQNIMAGSLKLLYHHGYKRLTLKNIAEYLNIDMQTLLSLYSSPIEIMTDTIQWAIRFGDALSNDLEGIADPGEKLNRYILMHFAFISSNPEMATLLLADESISGSRRIHDKLRQLRSHRIALLKKVLCDGSMKRHWVSEDTDQMALMILGFMRMTITSWKQSQTHESLYVRGKAATQFIEDILVVR